MDEFRILCTEEQTLKALELGAQIEHRSDFCDPSNRYFRIKTHRGKYYTPGYCYVKCPTAEQMIGWLETQGDIEEITIQRNRAFHTWAYLVTNKRNKLVGCKNIYQSRPEATLAAIDAALEYLNNNKK